MKNPALPADTPQHRLPFYLAMEEWVARALPPDDYFFAWRVAPTVICGRNQDMVREVDMAYCRAEGIDVVRRRSGGGCVYADMSNWMFSYITPSDEISSTFSRYTAMVASMLASLGFDARATGRNDLLIGNRKVAGNAFYHLPVRSIVHGTMLCEIDATRMSRAITPSRAKLESKGVKSVQSHITCLKAEGLAMPVADLGPYAISFLCGDDTLRLTPPDVAAIREIEQTYYDPCFLFGRHNTAEETDAGLRRRRRIDGVGEFEVCIRTDEGRIASLNFSGDFFVTGDVEGLVAQPLRDRVYSREVLSDALAEIDPSAAIPGLSREALLDLLID